MRPKTSYRFSSHSYRDPNNFVHIGFLTGRASAPHKRTPLRCCAVRRHSTWQREPETRQRKKKKDITKRREEKSAQTASQLTVLDDTPAAFVSLLSSKLPERRSPFFPKFSGTLFLLRFPFFFERQKKSKTGRTTDASSTLQLIC